MKHTDEGIELIYTVPGDFLTVDTTGLSSNFLLVDSPHWNVGGAALVLNPPGPIRRWLLARLGITWKLGQS